MVQKKEEKAKKEAAERIKKYEKRLRKTEVNVKRYMVSCNVNQNIFISDKLDKLTINSKFDK